MSNSTFTISLTFILLKLVSFSVCGIIFISKYELVTLDIVKETPLIEIEAFSIKDFCNLILFNLSFVTQVLSIIFIFITFAVVSTWPCT